MKPFFIISQYCLPQHALSRFIGRLMNTRQVWLKNALITWFVKRYGVDMSQAAEKNPLAYPTFNEFFIRHLKPDARPIIENASTILSPADGQISQLGKIQDNTLFQAKGIHYSLQALLGDDEWAQYFEHGHFATIYLSPKDYHRAHMPLPGKLMAMRYIPGKLFSVNNLTTEHVPGLFARNERAVCLFDTPQGKMVIVLVGAMIVASIHTAWSGQQVAPSSHKQINTIDYTHADITLRQGEEMGYFCLGSTAIVLLANPHATWLPTKTANSLVTMGEAIGTL